MTDDGPDSGNEYEHRLFLFASTLSCEPAGRNGINTSAAIDQNQRVHGKPW